MFDKHQKCKFDSDHLIGEFHDWEEVWKYIEDTLCEIVSGRLVAKEYLKNHFVIYDIKDGSEKKPYGYVLNSFFYKLGGCCYGSNC